MRKSSSLIPICTKCNNNDTRNVPTMMIHTWGEKHENTLRVGRYLRLFDKEGKDIIPE